MFFKFYSSYLKKLKRNRIKEPHLSILTILSNSITSKKSKIQKYWFKSPKKLAGITPKNHEIASSIKLLNKRLRHFPLQYIEKLWFYGEIKLKVKPPVFIPRQESSQIVDICIEELEKRGFMKRKNNIRFFEIGTGSGAISCLLLSRMDKLTGIGCELKKKAFNLSLENLMMNIGESFGKVYRLENKDFRDFEVKTEMEKFDFIVSNPPYIGFDEYINLEKQVFLYESKAALLSENDGFWHVEEILKWGKNKLNDRGFVVLELDYRQIERLEDCVSDICGGYWKDRKSVV